MTRKEEIIQAALIEGKIDKDFADNFMLGAIWADEHPIKEPVSEDLEEAAEKYADGENPTCPCEECLIKTFKAGAEWQANQGVTKEAVIGMATEEIAINVSQSTLDALDLCAGDKVVIQIRKKED